MGAKTQRVGSQGTGQLAGDFLNFLKAGLSSGQFSAGNQPSMGARDNLGQTSSIADAINRALSGGFQPDVTDLKTGITAQAERQKELGTGELLNRFGISGNRYSTGAEAGVGDFIAQSNEALNRTLGNIDLARAAEGNATSQNVLNTLFGAYQQAVGKGIPDASYIVKPGPLGEIAGLGQAGASVYKTASGGM